MKTKQVIKDFFKKQKLGKPISIKEMANWKSGTRYLVSTFLKRYIVYMESDEIVGIRNFQGKIY